MIAVKSPRRPREIFFATSKVLEWEGSGFFIGHGGGIGLQCRSLLWANFHIFFHTIHSKASHQRQYNSFGGEFKNRLHNR